MENFYLKQKNAMPGIFFDQGTGKLEITGQSSPPNADIFYKPVMEWLDNYMKYPCKTTTLKIFLNYFNTMSSKAIFEILKKMQKLSDSGKDVKVRWFYVDGDIDLEEAGSDFKSIVDLPFEMVLVEE